MTPTNDLEMFRVLYPSLNAQESYIEIEPPKIVKTLFSKNTLVSQVNSYERCDALVNKLPHLRERTDLIWSLYTKRLNKIERPIPERIA